MAKETRSMEPSLLLETIGLLMQPPCPRPSVAEARRDAPQTLYDEVHRLRAAGSSMAVIAQHLRISRPTMRKYLRASMCPHRAARRTIIGTLSSYDAHLRTRWSEGCHRAVERTEGSGVPRLAALGPAACRAVADPRGCAAWTARRQLEWHFER
jgi:hypothetical protein